MLRFLFSYFIALTFTYLHSEITEPFTLSIQEILSISPRVSQEKITTEQLQYWDKICTDLTAKETPGNALRTAAYLYCAQKAFADNAFILTGSYEGSLDPISQEVVKLFYPDFTTSRKLTSDSLSLALTKEVFTSIKQRCDTENQNAKRVANKEGPEFWKGKLPYDGSDLPSMQPWTMQSADQFRLPKPADNADTAFWQEQAQQVKKSTENITDQQKQRVLYWAGKTGIGSGDWRYIANQYMEEHNVPLEKRLEVRELLAWAMFDALLAACDSKYTYWIKRPVMVDADIKTVIPTPNHPSFPSGHSTVGAAASIVLTHFFPENKQQWDFLAEEAGMSRIWGGVHFPIDHEEGKKLGKLIGEYIVSQQGPKIK